MLFDLFGRSASEKCFTSFLAQPRGTEKDLYWLIDLENSGLAIV